MIRKTRFMSLVFLVLSVSFFFVPEFLEGMGAGLGPLWHGSGDEWWVASAGQLPVSQLDRMAKDAEESSDSLTLAFVALQHPDTEQQVRLANLAVHFDSEFTWVYYALDPASRSEGVARDWFTKMQAWDPENAVPYLAQASWLFQTQKLDRYYGTDPSVLQSLSESPEWMDLMAKAFQAPQYDPYHIRLFNVVRGNMKRHNIERPAILIKMMSNAPVPNGLNSQMYANVLVFKYGQEAETAGRRQRALDYYQSALHHGDLLQAHSTSLTGKLIGQALTRTTSQRLAPLLRRLDRAEDARALETRVAGFRQRYIYFSPLGKTSHNLWNALLMILFSSLVIIYGLFTLASVSYTNARRWLRLERRGTLFEFLTVSENYAPILLFMACLGLFLTYYPYAANFDHYMNVTEEIYDFEPLFWNILPTIMLLPGSSPALDFGNPFTPYIWYALFFLVLAIGYILYERRQADKGVYTEPQGSARPGGNAPPPGKN
jgi:hypothetical protein